MMARWKRMCLLGCILLMLSVGLCQGKKLYECTLIENEAYGHATTLYTYTDSGKGYGYYFKTSSSSSKTFARWSEAEGWQDVTFPEGTADYAVGLSENGSLFGTGDDYSFVMPEGGGVQNYLFHQARAYNQWRMVSSKSISINGDGDIVGYVTEGYSWSGPTRQKGFLRQSSGAISYFEDPESTGKVNRAFINDNEVVIGGVYRVWEPYQNSVAVWSNGTGHIVSDGYYNSSVSAINNHDVYAAVGSDGYVNHAYLYDLRTGEKQTITDSETSSPQVTGISDDNTVIGTIRVNNRSVYYIWTEESGLQLAKDLVLMPDGYELSSISRITAGGVIVGRAKKTNYQSIDDYRAVLLRPHDGAKALSVDPAYGSIRGGAQVTISGSQLGNGNDITRVSVCGAEAVILSQTADSVTVQTGAGMSTGFGEVALRSDSQGTASKENAYKTTGVVLDPVAGPSSGGNTVRLLASSAFGSMSQITAVSVCGVDATITARGTDWVDFTVGESTDPVIDVLGDLVLTSSSQGEIVFADAYTYSAGGRIGYPDVLHDADINGVNGTFLATRGSVGKVNGIGDINHDGYDDLAFTEPVEPKSDVGQVTVIYGRADSAFGDAWCYTGEIDGENGFILKGRNVDGVFSVNAAGDFNGDGMDDFVLGYGNECYLVYGRNSKYPSEFDVTVLDGTDGFRITGKPGSGFCNLGDLNKDGCSDITWYSGGVVLYGTPDIMPASQTITQYKQREGYGFEADVAAQYIGDVNGDGYLDIKVAGCAASAYGNNVQVMCRIVFGTAEGFHNMDFDNIPAGAGVSFIAPKDETYWGNSGYSMLQAAGDVNGDGCDDLLLGNGYLCQTGGEAYVVYGATNISWCINLGMLNGQNGYTLTGFPGEGWGNSAWGGGIALGDMNGDGYDDYMLRSYVAENRTGMVYVVFGQSEKPAATRSLSAIKGDSGFGALGVFYSELGKPYTSAAGDVNGDGLDDAIAYITRTRHYSKGYKSGVWLVYGRETGAPISDENGPSFGGRQITVTGNNLGSGSDITNVTVCGVAATIVAQTTDSVTILTGDGMSPGLGDIVIYSESRGIITAEDAYNAQNLTAPTVVDIAAAATQITVTWQSTPGTQYDVVNADTELEQGENPENKSWGVAASVTADADQESATISFPANKKRMYYQVAKDGDVNGAKVYGAFRIPLHNGWTALAPPVDMDRGMDGAFGQALANVLPAAANEAMAQAEAAVWDGSSWHFFWLKDGPVWCDSGSSDETTYELPLGRGIFVKNLGAATEAVFAGEVGQSRNATNAVSVGRFMVTLSRGLNVPLQQAFSAAVRGRPVGSGNPDNADLVYYINQNGSWSVFQYVDGTGTSKDGKWIDIGSGGGRVTTKVMLPGETFYYQRHNEELKVKF